MGDVFVWNGGMAKELSEEERARMARYFRDGKANAVLARVYTHRTGVLQATPFLVSDDGEAHLSDAADADPDSYAIGWIAYVEGGLGQKWIENLKEEQLMLDFSQPTTSFVAPPRVIDDPEHAENVILAK